MNISYNRGTLVKTKKLTLYIMLDKLQACFLDHQFSHSCPFSLPGSHTGHSCPVLGLFLSLPLFPVTVTILRSTGQTLCRLFLTLG